MGFGTSRWQVVILSTALSCAGTPMPNPEMPKQPDPIEQYRERIDDIVDEEMWSILNIERNRVRQELKALWIDIENLPPQEQERQIKMTLRKLKKEAEEKMAEKREAEKKQQATEEYERQRRAAEQQEMAEKEKRLQTKSSFETILEESLPIYHEDSKTWEDRILSPHAVTQYFFQNRFRYTGKEEEIDYQGKKERIHRFALVGEKSGYLGAHGKDKNRWKSTTLIHAVNILLDVKNLSDDDLKIWLFWLYKKSFDTWIDTKRITIQRNAQRDMVSNITYDAPDDFKNRIAVERVIEIKGLPTIEPGGRTSKTTETQKIVAPDGRLLLPSGISPHHDLMVPRSLLKTNPTFTLQLNGYGTWAQTASMLAERIHNLQKRQQEHPSSQRTVDIEVYGREQNIEKIAPLIKTDDPHIKMLAEFVTKGIPKKAHARRIMAITRFVQALPYNQEYDTDIDRPGLLTLFNGGGDCNNVTILWIQLMLAAGYDAAIIHTDERAEDYVTHAMGGIPEKYFPQSGTSWGRGENPTEWWIPIELTEKKRRPGDRKLGENKAEDVTLIEILRTQ